MTGRDSENETAAFSGSAFYGYGASVDLDQALANEQPYSGSFLIGCTGR